VFLCPTVRNEGTVLARSRESLGGSVIRYSSRCCPLADRGSGRGRSSLECESSDSRGTGSRLARFLVRGRLSRVLFSAALLHCPSASSITLVRSGSEPFDSRASGFTSKPVVGCHSIIIVCAGFESRHRPRWRILLSNGTGCLVPRHLRAQSFS